MTIPKNNKLITMQITAMSFSKIIGQTELNTNVEKIVNSQTRSDVTSFKLTSLN